MRRLISFFLAVALCLTVFPAATDAAEAETQADEGIGTYAVSLAGSGTAADPYLIGTAQDLVKFRKLVNGGETSACARLTDDIVFHSGTFTYDKTTNDPLYNGAAVPADLEQWIPIGVPDSTDFSFKKGWYTGTFDGAGHTISGLYSNYQTEVQLMFMSAASLFCGIGKGGVVKNVHIANSYFRGDGAAGIALGCQGSIIACMNEGIVIGMPKSSGNLNYAGGILCLSMYADAKIERCLNIGPVVGSSGNRGCIAAKNGIGKVTFNGITVDLGIPKTEGYKYNYYLKTTNGSSISGCVEASEQALAGGEIAYMLNSRRAEGDVAYGQTIGVDPYPKFGGETVCKVLACDGKSDAYSNTDAPKAHDFAGEGSCGRCTVCGQMAYVGYTTPNGRKNWALTLEEAFAAVAGTTATVTLYTNVSQTETVVLESGDITLDLNGSIATDDLKIAFNIKGGALTVQGNGKISNTYAEESGSYGVITVNSGSLTVKGGSIEAAGNYALASVGGTTRIEGGSFTSQLDHAATLSGDVLLSGGGFRGIITDDSLSGIVAGGCAVKLVDEKKWDLEMASNAVTGQVQIRQIPFAEASAAPAQISTFEGYTPDVAPKFTVTTDADMPTYRWYEVLSDGTEQLLSDQVTNSLTLPEGKSAGLYQYRWEVVQDDLVKFGYVNATVLTMQGNIPDVSTQTEPTYDPVAPPTLETEPPQVQIPAPTFESGVIGKNGNNDIILLDVAPLQGLTLTDLGGQLSFAGLEGYNVTLAITGNSGGGKVRTSDRLLVTARNNDGEILATRTFILCVMGDINCDGMTLANDAALVMRIKLGTVQAADEVFLAADLDQSGELSANDSRRLVYKYYNWDVDYQSVLQ